MEFSGHLRLLSDSKAHQWTNFARVTGKLEIGRVGEELATVRPEA